VNAIGIDFQRTLTSLHLREGQGIAARFRAMGDGRGAQIPNAVAMAATTGGGTTATAWGSAALSHPRAERLCGSDTLAPAPWTDEPQAVEFLRCVGASVRTYLGGLEPIPRNGYQVVLTAQGIGLNDLGRVQQIVLAAGLSEALCIPACDALVARWLMEPASSVHTAGPGQRTVVAVTIGDVCTQVAAYTIRPGSEPWPAPPRVDALPGTISITAGHAWWAAELLKAVESRVPEGADHDDDASLHVAALEFAVRLTSANGGVLRWTGALSDRMYEPLELTVADCWARWPEAMELRRSLGRAVGEVSRRSAPQGPHLVLLGGIGAAWPFARDALRAADWATWESGSPHDDLARGAAAWPLFVTALRRAHHASIGEAAPDPGHSPPQESPADDDTIPTAHAPDLPFTLRIALEGSAGSDGDEGPPEEGLPFTLRPREP
jgi:hypothetical protein